MDPEDTDLGGCRSRGYGPGWSWIQKIWTCRVVRKPLVMDTSIRVWTLLRVATTHPPAVVEGELAMSVVVRTRHPDMAAGLTHHHGGEGQMPVAAPAPAVVLELGPIIVDSLHCRGGDACGDPRSRRGGDGCGRCGVGIHDDSRPAVVAVVVIMTAAPVSWWWWPRLITQRNVHLDLGLDLDPATHDSLPCCHRCGGSGRRQRQGQQEPQQLLRRTLQRLPAHAHRVPPSVARAAHGVVGGARRELASHAEEVGRHLGGRQ